ncbi:MAG: CBS domain-containing protein [Desulfovibrionales bacterium]
MTAGELCIREVVIAYGHEAVLIAARRMREMHVGNLVVVEERNNEMYPTGILTDRDIVVGVIAEDVEHLTSLAVKDIIRNELVTVDEDDDYTEVLKRMRVHSIRRVPVVNEKGVLQGILSIDDLIQQISEELSDLVVLLSRQSEREKQRRS